MLTANTEAEKTLLSSDLVSLFRRFSTSWGDQMTSILANAINAVLDGKDGGTLIDVRRFLVEPGFRKKVLQTVSDSYVIYYWENEFPMLRKNIVAPILTRLDTFLRSRIVRNMMIQTSKIDFADLVNNQKILLVKLAQGLIGEENSYLLETLFVSKIHQIAQTRQNISQSKRKPFYFYIDEFQNFITPSMSSILSGARKYGLGLILAHQNLDQLARKDNDLLNSVLSNSSIRVCFRCGDKDSTKMENGFSYFTSTDLQNLNTGHAIARIEKKDNDFTFSFSLLARVDKSVVKHKKQIIISQSRNMYALPQSEVEKILDISLTRKSETTLQILKEKKTVDKSSHTQSKEEDPDRDVSKSNIQQEAQEFIEKEDKKERQREHRLIQEHIKKVAEGMNFKVILEESVNNNTGKVDVGLHHNDLAIACEISVTNTVEYEVRNIQKCLDADFLFVFMISNDQKHLNNIRNKAISEIDQSQHGSLFFVSKEEFIDQLNLILSTRSKPVEERIGGYRVKVKYGEASDLSGKKKVLKDFLLSSIKRKGL